MKSTTSEPCGRFLWNELLHLSLLSRLKIRGDELKSEHDSQFYSSAKDDAAFGTPGIQVPIPVFSLSHVKSSS